jgi:hypothetical protein
LAKPDKVDGFNVPSGRIPQEIKDNRYPRTYFPGTEKLAADEMRVTAVGTGMPTQTPSNAAAAFLVELGNGDSFLFDLGTGSTERLSGLETDYSKLDKVFVSHLHTDHIGDLAALWVGGWLGGRYTPMHVYGPSGATPELGRAPKSTLTISVTPGPGTLRHVQAPCPMLAAKSSPTNSISLKPPSFTTRTASKSPLSQPFISATVPSASAWTGTA